MYKRQDYNEIDDFVVADGFFIYFYDSELGEQTNAPIGQTLADFLLRKELRLSGDVSVTQTIDLGNNIAHTIVESADKGAGTLTLYFQKTPFALQKWEVQDAAGLKTEIKFTNFEQGLKLPSSLFRYLDPQKSNTPSYNE